MVNNYSCVCSRLLQPPHLVPKSYVVSSSVALCQSYQGGGSDATQIGRDKH